MKKKVLFTSKYHFNLNEETNIQPAKNFIPKHWKDLPYYENNNYNLRGRFKTAKACPSFVEIFKEGYVIPAPCDIWLYTDNEEWKWETASPIDFIKITNHTNNQYVNSISNTNIKNIFKLDGIWNCITPKGYSVRQIPMIYHHNPDFYVMYGIIHTDKLHQINPQIAFISDKKEIVIHKGTPLCYIVPFKREKFKLEIVDYNENIEKKVYKSNLNYLAAFSRKNYNKED